MTPILLERTDFLKIGTTVVLLLTTVFVAGFIFGYSRAEQQQITMASIDLDVPPASESSEAVDRNPIVPENVEQGHDRDVDVADDEPDEPHHTHFHASMETVTNTVEMDASITAEPDTGNPESVNKPEDLGVGGPHAQIQADPVELMMDTADESSARFTLQVGMFSRAANAERKLDMLRSMNLSAYTSEFTDSKDRTRFNVRLGYFDRKREALAALQSYREVFSSDGYLVSINR